jgi:DNA repair protein RadD
MAQIDDRQYQDDAVQNARKALGKVQRALINAPTGAGKTVIASTIIKSAVKKGSCILFLAHRRELVNQCSAKLDDFGVVNHGVIMRGHFKARNKHAPVQVASIQTLIRRELPPADLIVIDECHRAVAKSYLDVLSNYPKAKVLGLTATPERTDGKGLDSLFEDIITVASTPWLIEQGFLVKPDVWVSPTGVDPSKIVKRKTGDYTQEEMARIEQAMDTPTLCGDIVRHYRKHAEGRPAVVFAMGIQHSLHLTEAFQAEGIATAHVDGETPVKVRDDTIRDWKAGKIQVVCNVGVFVEGFDFPELYCCILARPTKSVTIYLQAVGRVMRPAPGKTRCIVLDHAGCIDEHGAPHEERVWTLQGETKTRKKKEFFHRTCRCGFHFEADPKLFLADVQDASPNPEIADKQRRLLKGPDHGQALVVCPACREADCVVCKTPFHPAMESRKHDGTDATFQATVCPACQSLYTDNGVHVLAEAEEKALPGEIDADLVPLDDERAAETHLKLTVKNEFNRFMEEAKQRGLRRGWAFGKIVGKFGEDAARNYLPRRKGDWWKEVAS